MDVPTNAKRYAPPKDYYRHDKGRVANPPLIKALSDYVDASLPKVALDFGCGAGYETQFLLDHGWSVIAVDGNAQAKTYIKKLPHQERVTFVQSEFEKFDFDRYSLINSSFALPFTHRDAFQDVFSRLAASINSGGLFTGNLFGNEDEWNKQGETMTFLRIEEVKTLLKGFEVLQLGERKQDGTVANGKPKFWHTFDIIARKN